MVGAIQEFQKHVEFIGVILGSLATLVVTCRFFKTWISAKWRKHREYIEKRNAIPGILGDIQNKIMGVDARLQTVENEIKPNGGGSMKDALRIVKAEIEATFWLNARPSFRTTSNGVFTLVNEAYCHLCGVSSEDLLRLNWKNFASDEEQLDDFMRRWMDSAKECSQFSGKLKIKNFKNEEMGEWTIKIRPLGPLDNGEDYLWHGMLYPYDYQSIEYAKAQNIPMA